MQWQPDKLTDEFYATNRRLKQDMLKAGIGRPNRRLLLLCLLFVIGFGLACIVESLRGHDLASNILLMFSIFAAVSMVLVQMSPRLAEFIKSRRKRAGDEE